MHLWTEYEGNTLAGYPLGRLNRSEGRNAFFATTTTDGQPAMLRLTESHFDEGELVGRWRKVAAVPHPNLQAINHFGQTTFDGVRLACCLLELTDGSLANALREGVLSVEETKEIAEAVSGAVAALHGAGLVHEHIDATNVFAMGEVVKLRSDCCRECAGDFEADTHEAREALRQRDVHDFGLLLLRCLGLDWQGSSSSIRLPAPFDRIIPGALDGTLTAADIAEILQPPSPARIESAVQPAKPVAITPGSASSPAMAVERNFSSGSVGETSHNDSAAMDAGAVATERLSPKAHRASAKSLQRGTEGLRNRSGEQRGTQLLSEELKQRRRPMKLRGMSAKSYMAYGAAAAILGLAVWAGIGGNGHVNDEPHAAIVENKPETSQTIPTQPQLPKPSAIAEAAPTQSSFLASGERTSWHVIAYTYKYEQQAQAQVMKLQQRYVNLHPQVFTPTGHAPYFVALGNASDSATAIDLRNRARQVGLPRDTYARNF